MFTGHINDFETQTKCFNQIIFLFSSNLIHQLLSFWIFSSFSFSIFFFIFLEELYSFFLFLIFFLSLNNNNKLSNSSKLSFFSTIMKSQASRISSHYQSLVNTMEQRWWYFEVVECMSVMWVNKEKLMMYMAQVGYS